MLLAKRSRQALLPRQAAGSWRAWTLPVPSIYCDETGGDYYDLPSGFRAGPAEWPLPVGDVTGTASPPLDPAHDPKPRGVPQRERITPEIWGQVVHREVNRSPWTPCPGGELQRPSFSCISSMGVKEEIRWVRAGHEAGNTLRSGPRILSTELVGGGIALGGRRDLDLRGATARRLEGPARSSSSGLTASGRAKMRRRNVRKGAAPRHSAPNHLHPAQELVAAI